MKSQERLITVDNYRKSTEKQTKCQEKKDGKKTAVWIIQTTNWNIAKKMITEYLMLFIWKHGLDGSSHI